jgi:acyl-coenzyme A synthetase/AMP-(fatty) acid ligase
MTQPSLGELAEHAAATHGTVKIWLDAPLDVAPAEGTELDYAGFANAVREMSAALHAGGVRPGDRVAVIKRNNFDVLAIVCGAVRIGAVAAPINAQQEPEAHAVLLKRLERPVLVIDERTLTGLQAAGIDVSALAHRTIAVDGPVDGAVSLTSLRGAPVPSPVPRQAADPLFITHSSGTTGVPKLVLHTGGSLRAHARLQVRLCRMLRLRETVAVCWSYSHLRAIGGLVMFLSLGLPMVALTDTEPAAAGALLSRLKPGVVETYPNVFMRWEGLASGPSRPFAGVRFFGSTFDAVHPRTIGTMLAASDRRWAAYFNVYGQSEIGPATVKMYTRRYDARATGGHCVGWSMPGITRVRVVDPETGAALSRGRPGLIEVATRGRFETYVGEDDRAEQGRSGEWWRTGDLGHLTGLRCLHLLDRVADVVPSVPSTLQVEDILLERLPALTEVVILTGGEGLPLPVLSTEGDAPLDEAGWEQATAGLPRLAPPVRLRWPDLPRTATFKVRRHLLARNLARLAASADPRT